MDYYIVKNEKGSLSYDEALAVDSVHILTPERIEILKFLAKKPSYPLELAKQLNMHEQKIYYHIKKLQENEIIEVIEKKEVRGTTAKKFKPKKANFIICIAPHFKSMTGLLENKNKQVQEFLKPFINNGRLDADIVVGNPDPHGAFKARARDGHYAIDLGVFLGNFCELSSSFSVSLDVEADEQKNLIIVGGPVTNLLMNKMNMFLPCPFVEGKNWIIQSKRTQQQYSDDNIGMIARIPNPFNKEKTILAIAGVRFSGTKASVIGLTRFAEQVLFRFTGQKEFFAIVHGFDLDGDGKLDAIEVIE